MCAKLQETFPQHLKIMFAVSSDIFSFLLASALGLTIFLQFSDFPDIYRGMEVCGIHDSSVQWDCICIALIIYKSVTPIFPLVTEYVRLYSLTRRTNNISLSHTYLPECFHIISIISWVHLFCLYLEHWVWIFYFSMLY